MAANIVGRYERMLLQLGYLVTPADLEKLKFACKSVIPTSIRERIDSSEAFFLALEERGQLSESNLTYLKDMLKTALIRRTDVLKIVDEYELGSPLYPNTDGIQHSPDFLIVCQYLEEHLGKEWKSFLRRLGVADHHIHHFEHDYPRNIKEVIHQCLFVWLCDNKQLQYSQQLTAVINALRKENRNDLGSYIEGQFR